MSFSHYYAPYSVSHGHLYYTNIGGAAGTLAVQVKHVHPLLKSHTERLVVVGAFVVKNLIWRSCANADFIEPGGRLAESNGDMSSGPYIVRYVARTSGGFA